MIIGGQDSWVVFDGQLEYICDCFRGISFVAEI